MDARGTQNQLRQLLRRYPPQVGEVLRLDPSLLEEPGYLSTYPELQTFLQQHPEIVRNAAFYFGTPSDGFFASQNASVQAVRSWEQMVTGATVLAGFVSFFLVAAWVIRSIMEHRRWLRASRVQVDAHTKLLDRFTSNADLLAYIETSAGRRFLEAAPLTLDAGTGTLTAPVGRILWSVQAGVVLAAAGVGLHFVGRRLIEEIGRGVGALGIVLLALGIGFVLSAGVAYGLSRRLGLLEPGPRPAPVGPGPVDPLGPHQEE